MRSRYIQNDILFYLSDGKPHSSEELAEAIEVSVVTIRRHIKDLSLNYPIVSFVGGVGGGGGYRMLSEIALQLTVEDIEVIVDSLEKTNVEGDKNVLISKLKKYKNNIR